MAERRIDALTVRWYEVRGRSPGIVERWLAAAREHLPEAIPRRFGDSEPLRGRGDVGPAYGKARNLFFLQGRPPVHHASWSALDGAGPVAVHSMQAELDAGDERARRFALAIVHPGTVYVSASVTGGLTLDGGTLWGPGDRPGEPYLAPRGDWLGLPPEAPAWCWFGPGYARLLRGRVAGREVSGGLLHSGVDGPWAGEPLRARLDEPDPARRHAPRMPRGLRVSRWRALLGGR